LTLGRPLESGSDLGKGIRELAAGLIGPVSVPAGQKPSARVH